jgi:hypothetical protein
MYEVKGLIARGSFQPKLYSIQAGKPIRPIPFLHATKQEPLPTASRYEVGLREIARRELKVATSASLAHLAFAP